MSLPVPYPHVIGSLYYVPVMFLAEGNMKGGVNKEHRARGFPAVSLLDAEPT
jgi:hypothetical protein